MRHCLNNSDPRELIFFECQTFFQTLAEKGGEDSHKLIKLYGLQVVTAIYNIISPSGLTRPAAVEWRAGWCWTAGDLGSAFNSSASVGMCPVQGYHEESKVFSVPE